MFLTIILVVSYWILVSVFNIFTEQTGYFHAFLPIETKEIILRLLSVLFILAGNIYFMIRKKDTKRGKEVADKSYGLKEVVLKNNLDFYSDVKSKKDSDFKNKYFIHRINNSILKLFFEKISLQTFIKLSLNLIISDRIFLNSLGALVFLTGDQPNTLQLKTYYNVPHSIAKGCSKVKFQKCTCGLAAHKKSIQFIKAHENCPDSLDEYFPKPHNHYCIPLMHQGRLLGTLDLMVDPISNRTKESDEYLMTIGNTIAMGIKHKQEMDQTNKINHCLSRLSGDPYKNIKTLVKLFGDILGNSSVFYERYNKKNQQFYSFYQYNAPQYYDDQESEDSLGYDILNSAFQPVTIRNLPESKYIKKNLNILQNNFLTCIGARIQCRNEPIGVIYAFYKKDFKPTKKDEYNLRVVSSAIGNEEEHIYQNKDLKEAYSKLKKTQGSLVQSEKLAALGRFSSGIAHEVKNPLGVVLGGIEFLEKKINNPEKDIKFALAKVKDSTLRANDIVQNLLTFAKPSARKNEVIDLKQLIEETLSLLKYKVSLGNIKIINEVKEAPKGILGDKNQIQQVLFNLFLNAIESMPKGGKIKVKVNKASSNKLLKGKHNCVIEIIDTGEGIPEENLAKIFEPFFTTKRDAKGTGLGLAMCKMIIENNDGKLLLKNNINQGTTAQIILPINP